MGIIFRLVVKVCGVGQVLVNRVTGNLKIHFTDYRVYRVRVDLVKLCQCRPQMILPARIVNMTLARFRRSPAGPVDSMTRSPSVPSHSGLLYKTEQTSVFPLQEDTSARRNYESLPRDHPRVLDTVVLNFR